MVGRFPESPPALHRQPSRPPISSMLARFPHHRPGSLLLPAVMALVTAGCEIRDEQARPQATSLRWPAPVTRRLEEDASPAGITRQHSICFVDDCAAGRRLADAAGKPLLIVFRANWCRWSAAFSQQTLTDPTIVALADRFVCVLVDADRHAEVCQQYDVAQFPTILILDVEHNELTRRSGHTLAADLHPLLRQALSPRQVAAAGASTDLQNTQLPDPETVPPVQTAEFPGDAVSR